MKVVVEKLDNLGQGIAYVNNKIVFIKGALPLEEVEIDILKDKKNYQIGKVNKIIKSSVWRKENKCPFHKFCGGCNLGHFDLKESLNYKKDKLKNIILKNTKLDIESIIVSSKNVYNYRNKITLKIENYKWGYYNLESHIFCAINECLLAKKGINEVIHNQSKFNIESGEIVLRCNDRNEILISIKTNDKVSIDTNVLDNLNIVGIVINDKTVYGQNYFYHTINNLQFKVSYNSFFQINDDICGKIFNILNDIVLGKSVLDLYCGVGSLGISVSGKISKLYGIEIIENAIKDAKINASNNNILNSKYLVGSVEDNLKEIENIDTIIVDPPRKGLNNIDEIINIGAKTLVYISCDPVTLGRDLKELVNYYDIDKTYMLDMFPNTYHVECVSLLHRKSLEKITVFEK